MLLTTGVIATPDLAAALADLSERLGSWTYVLVALLAFLETAAFVGLIAPGETALALGGVVAAHGQAQLPVMIAVAWLGAAGGDLTSFLLGRRIGRAALDRHGGRIGLGPERVAHVEGFFTAHGP